MKKLWKQEWKYHIGFTLLTILLLFAFCERIARIDNYFGFGNEINPKEELTFLQLLDNLSWSADGIMYEFFSGVMGTVGLALLAKKTMLYWIEKDSCGREFFQSLPIAKQTRKLFHFLMDGLLIITSVVVYGIVEYNWLAGALMENWQIELPWLEQSYVGLVLTTISYLFMLLGLLYFIECLFVNGVMKVVGFGSFLFMGYLGLNALFDQFYESQLMQKIYGFFAMESVGGTYYSLTEAIESEYGFFSSMGNRYVWLHEHVNPPVCFAGEWVDYSAQGITSTEYRNWLYDLNRFFDFANIGSYVGYALCYLVIGLILIGLSVWLSSKMELSKNTFFFDFARYLVSAAMAVTVGLMIIEWHGKVWLIVLDIVATIIVFCLLLYLLNTNRKKIFMKQSSNTTKEVEIS